MSKLKPCPFCGSTDVGEEYGGCINTSKGLHQSGEVECYTCGAQSATISHNEKDNNGLEDLGDAVKDAWNRRSYNE